MHQKSALTDFLRPIAEDPIFSGFLIGESAPDAEQDEVLLLSPLHSYSLELAGKPADSALYLGITGIELAS